MHGWLMTNLKCEGDGIGKYCISGSTTNPFRGSFFLNGGFTGGNTAYDFWVNSPASPALSFWVANLNSENSNRFLGCAGVTGATARITIENVRWGETNLNADGNAINYLCPGPIIVRNSQIGESYNKSIHFVWAYGANTQASLTLENFTMGGTDTTVAAVFTSTIPQRYYGLVLDTTAIANVWP
jgi:hypothetical protein